MYYPSILLTLDTFVLNLICVISAAVIIIECNCWSLIQTCCIVDIICAGVSLIRLVACFDIWFVIFNVFYQTGSLTKDFPSWRKREKGGGERERERERESVCTPSNRIVHYYFTYISIPQYTSVIYL